MISVSLKRKLNEAQFFVKESIVRNLTKQHQWGGAFTTLTENFLPML